MTGWNRGNARRRLRAVAKRPGRAVGPTTMPILAPLRTRDQLRGKSTAKAGQLLRGSIAIRKAIRIKNAAT
ncbi:hypothetical protein [Actinomyces gaoshouyii]|uniref:hypothetical protein n=1 Tax=Actinomyces gaoshouyii TaxID=1960083 RepID=UPI0009B54483|nr:hypothetical protein [Actinomyces gaoshouyii]ARD41673.1 hypothetical protein B6G06_04390 [Actinomyces gaoshouyii]